MQLQKLDGNRPFVKTIKCKQAVTIALHKIVMSALMTSAWQYVAAAAEFHE
jgi:hypothetical protein